MPTSGLRSAQKYYLKPYLKIPISNWNSYSGLWLPNKNSRSQPRTSTWSSNNQFVRRMTQRSTTWQANRDINSSEADLIREPEALRSAAQPSSDGEDGAGDDQGPRDRRIVCRTRVSINKEKEDKDTWTNHR